MCKGNLTIPWYLVTSCVYRNRHMKDWRFCLLHMLVHSAWFEEFDFIKTIGATRNIDYVTNREYNIKQWSVIETWTQSLLEMVEKWKHWNIFFLFLCGNLWTILVLKYVSNEKRWQMVQHLRWSENGKKKLHFSLFNQTYG